MNIPALPLQTGEDEEGQTFEIKIIFSAKGWASPPTLHNRAAQGLDVRHLPSPSPCGRGEVFSLDIPFYRTYLLHLHAEGEKCFLLTSPFIEPALYFALTACTTSLTVFPINFIA